MSTRTGEFGRFGLGGYYLLEGLNALGTNVFFLGVFFHARLSHGFSDTANLLLAATQGAAYVSASRAGGRFADRVGVERSIACGLAGMCLALAAGWALPPAGGLFLAIALYSAATALTWPALEAAIARAPGKVPLARRAGLYNVIWSFVGAAGFFLSGPLFALDPNTIFWTPLAAHFVELAILGLAFIRASTSRRVGSETRAAFRATVAPGERRPEVPLPPNATEPVEGVAWRGGLRRPQRSEDDGGPQRQDPEADVHVATPPVRRLPPEAHARFLKSAWVANGLGYFLFGAFSALAPTLGERLGLNPRLAIWLVSSYLFARSAAFVLFWLWEGWEYRRGWLAAALALPPAAFALLFATRSSALAIWALVVLGALSGLAYSASLHASLDREGREGEGGGLHEWVIGLGVLLGPLAGVAGVRLIGGLSGAGGLVTALGAAAALAGILRLRTWRSNSPGP